MYANSRWLTLCGFGATLAGALTFASQSRAQPNDPALAETLFGEGRELFELGEKDNDKTKLAEACAKFEASHKADPSHGAVFNLATCNERTGKTASAWAAYLEAAALSKTPAESAEAKQLADKLVPRLVRLKIVAVQPQNDLVLRRDGNVQDRAAWGTAVPVDPGRHRVDADAPGRRSWSVTVAVEGEGKTITVEVPTLASAAPPAMTGNAVHPPSSLDLRRGVAIGVGALGVVSIAVGGVLAGVAKSKWDEAKPHCDAQRFCEPAWVSTGREARALADGANIPFVVGGFAVAGSVALWLLAPTKQDGAAPNTPTTSAEMWVGDRAGGISIDGRF